MPTLIELVTDPISLGIFALYAALLLWEALFPARALPKKPGFRPLGLLAFTAYFLISAYVPIVLADLVSPLRLFDAAGLGNVLGAAMALVLYELVAYAWHRALHSQTLLWRVFHQMHHSAERIDVPSAFWFSPLDMVGWTLVSMVPLTLLGLTPGALLLFALLTTFFGIFQHANIRTPEWLGYVMQRPENHSHHHAYGVHAGNYGNLSLVDMIFGTFSNHTLSAAKTGLGDGRWTHVWDMLLFRDVSEGAVLNDPPTRHVSGHQSGVGIEGA